MSTQQAVLVGVAAYLAYRVWCAASEKARTDTLPVVNALRAMLNMLRLGAQPFNDIFRQLSANTMDRGAYWMNFGGVANFIVSDAALAQQVFTKVETFNKLKYGELMPDSLLARMFGVSNVVFSNGDDWKRHRKVVSPPFHKALPLNAFVQVTKTLLDKFDKMPDTSNVDVNTWAQKITLDALGLAAFGYNFDSLNKENDEQVVRYNYIMKHGNNPLFVFFPWVAKIPFNPIITRIYREMDIFDEFLHSIIRNKRAALQQKKSKTPDEEKDLLELMLEANEVDNTLSDAEIRENAFIFFVAGHDTTSSTIASVLYNLATHQDKQDKLRQEIATVFAGKDASTITLDQQKELVYMTGCIKETLRMYPPVQILPQRKLAQEIDVVVGNETIHLEPGNVAAVNIFAIHHDEKHWEKPYEFMPERFVSDAKRHPYAWIPFGGGTRMCLGLNFSLVEQRVVLSMLLQKYRVTLPENSPHKNGLILEVQGLSAPKDLHLCFERI